MKDIFEKLNKKGICYAVCVALVEFKTEGSGLYDRDYFIIIAKADEEKVSGLRFIKNIRTSQDVLEYTLNKNEIKLFKALQNDFVKIVHNDKGRVYELKNRSFHEYYEFIKKEVEIESFK